MFSLRLPPDLEEKLTSLSAREGRSKSDLVKEALAEYLGRRDKEPCPYELGRDLFGRHGSGAGNLARDYKRLLKAKLHAKMPR
ncbi:MAG: ribbon-helix-helix protein, CopG family [Patescibacteria group bacterium]